MQGGPIPDPPECCTLQVAGMEKRLRPAIDYQGKGPWCSWQVWYMQLGDIPCFLMSSDTSMLSALTSADLPVKGS